MRHTLSEIEIGAVLADDVKVWQFSTVLAGTTIGDGSVVGANCWIGRNCRIGRNVRIQTGVVIPHGTVIEDDVFIGPGVVMTDDKSPRAGAAYTPLPPTIRRGASLAAGVIVFPGVEIGEGVMVAAGAVVHRSIPAGALVIGRGMAIPNERTA